MSLRDIKLKEEERVLRVVNRYGPTLFWQWLIGVCFVTLAFFLMFWLFGKGVWGQVGFIALLLLGFLILFRTYYLWRKNVFIITTHRLIDVEQPTFLQRNVSEVPHDQIEDVSGTMSGLWPTMLKFGNVHVQTGNGKVLIIAERVKRPLHLQQMINELRERYVSKYVHDFSGDLAATIIDKLYELEEEDLLKVRKALKKQLARVVKDTGH